MDYAKPTVLKLPIVLREVEVSRTEQVSPTLRRIWFKGEQLSGFSKGGRDLPPFRSEGPDDHVKFFFPSPVDGTLSLPTQADGTIDWPRDPRPVARDYTPRRFSEGDDEVAFDFVLHGHGVASVWAQNARPGDTLHVAGPKSSLLVPDADHFILAGDQTALPAICNWLERLGADTRADVIIWIDDDASRIEIETRADANIHWVVERDPSGQALLDVFKALPRPGANSFVWGAMEAGVLRHLRSHCLENWGLDRRQIDLTAYWRRGIDDDQILAASFKLREITDLSRPFAIRAAVEYRLPDLVAEGVTDIAALVARAGLDAGAFAQVLPVLVECGVFKRTGDKLSLDVTGELLTSPFQRNRLSDASAQGRIGLAAQGLSHFLKTGQPAYAATFGHPIETDAANDKRIGDGLGHDLGHMVGHLTGPALAPIAEHLSRPVTVIGLGADAVLTALLNQRPDISGTAVVPAYAYEEAREHIEEAKLTGRTQLIEHGASVPRSETLAIAAIGADWTDEAIAQAVTGHNAKDVWVIELVAPPESPELAQDAMRLGFAFGLRTATAETLSTTLALNDLAQKQSIETRTGLRLTRFEAIS